MTLRALFSMTTTVPPHPTLSTFVQRWERSGAAERANYQLFLSELCTMLEVPRPEPTGPDDAENSYVFERAVTFRNPDGSTSPGRIDLYRRGCFVLEAKQGSDLSLPVATQPKAKKTKRGTAVRGTPGWDAAMVAARWQAENYARALPVSEGWPPFLVVVDVGFVIELYSDFSCSGRHYQPFPDAAHHRLRLPDLADAALRERLRRIWTDPLSLDPTRRSAQVTRELASRLAVLARSLEDSGQQPERVAHFLMRCLFTMFAEDVRLLPVGTFTALLQSIRAGDVGLFPELVQNLWSTMRTGGVSPVLRQRLLRFNGGLFVDDTALPLTPVELDLLIEACEADWQEVEPAIFGTLLERALHPLERHQLGTHYTPRAYVERLVLPTVIQPLRQEWSNVQVAAVSQVAAGNAEAAVAEVRAFHQRLCATRILDPACGSGNFLYVTLEHMKRLEGEIFRTLADLGQTQTLLELEGITVSPQQLLGLEVNPRAAAITDLVLWIGYLQWHFRTRGDALPQEPVLQNFHNIQCRDAVLGWEAREAVLDADGAPKTVWDRRTTRRHPVTGEEVPDETARVPLYRYHQPHRPVWPAADYVVGNPPFIGNWRMRTALGDGYAETLRALYPEVPESADYVMYWWDRAAELTRTGAVRSFGLITTNSLPQAFNRRVVQRHLDAADPLSLVFAIPNHPWVDAADGAAVRISMTVGQAGEHEGLLQRVLSEARGNFEGRDVQLSSRIGKIWSDLTIGADVSSALPLQANSRLSCPGVKLHGSGFIVTRDEARQLGLGRILGLEQHIREYRNGRDLTQMPRDVLVIDLFGLKPEEVRVSYPEVYQWVSNRVKPERDASAGRTSDATQYAAQWWLFGKPRPELRKALRGLQRYISTVETAKHRFFVFLDYSILPDNMLINIAVADAYVLGILSSITTTVLERPP